MKKSILAGIALVFVSGLTNAACPSISGTWAMTKDQAIAGDTNAGVYRAVVGSSTIVITGYEGTYGELSAGKLRGNYTVSSACFVTFNYTIDGVPISGSAKGIIVDPNKIYFLFNSSTGVSGQVVAERMKTT